MKFLFISLLVLSGCSSWNQRDFKKELDKGPEETTPEVEADKKLLDKFEVQPVTEVKDQEPVKTEPAKTSQKKSLPQKKSQPKIVPKKEAPKKVQAAPQIKSKIPKDYPDHLKAMNATAKKVWDLYVPNHYVNEKVFLDINYLGMTVGKIMFTNKGKKMINDQEVWHFHARFKSAPFYSNIYELDDTVDTYVTTEKFLSIRYSLIQRESKQDIDDLQLHDREQMKTFWFYKQKKSDGDIKNKQKEELIPFFSIDPFSVLFFYQGLPLKNGDVYEIPLINKAKMLNLKSIVEGREVVQTKKGKRKAIRVHATTQYTGEHLKSGDLYLWFSDDNRRTLLKVQAKIKIGSVTAEMVDQE